MIIRSLEFCPHCGQLNPWRKYSTRCLRGKRRVYVKCRRCGATDVVIYVADKRKLPQWGNKYESKDLS